MISDFFLEESTSEIPINADIILKILELNGGIMKAGKLVGLINSLSDSFNNSSLAVTLEGNVFVKFDEDRIYITEEGHEFYRNYKLPINIIKLLGYSAEN